MIQENPEDTKGNQETAQNNLKTTLQNSNTLKNVLSSPLESFWLDHTTTVVKDNSAVV